MNMVFMNELQKPIDGVQTLKRTGLQSLQESEDQNEKHDE
jgi:hypothetical protein